LTRALSIHADYRCQNTGVCCSSGWDVPVEPGIEEGLREALAGGSLRAPAAASCFRPVAGLPHGARVVFQNDDRGRCVFLGSGDRPLCSVHHQLGPGSLASACRDFPRIVTLSPLGVSITLSHHCPTAAGLLFSEQNGLAIVRDPPAFPSSRPYEGLDARESFSPLLRPGVLMGWDAYARFEEHAVATLARDELSPEEALGLLVARAEAARGWRPEDGAFDGHLERCLREAPFVQVERPSRAESLRAWRVVASCVPAGHPHPSPPLEGDSRSGGSESGEWGQLGGPVRRWLAARAFASWMALQGEGLRTTVGALSLSLEVLRAEAARDTGEGTSPLGAPRLHEAFRRADLLLVHLADPEALARRLSQGEAVAGQTPW